MVYLQWIGKQLNMENEMQNEQHQMVLALADEIARMEQNLACMHEGTVGRKQLTRSLQRMKTHLKIAGYEVVDMLGQPYQEGMKVVANFKFDETLPEGQQVITAVVRPQVNYKGEMIQVAEIMVSQNF